MKFNGPTESNLSKSIHELQQMAFNNDVDIEQLLRRAYLLPIAVRQKDIEEWINNELPARNSILHRELVDYSDEEVGIAYKTLLIFVAHIIQMNESLSVGN